MDKILKNNCLKFDLLIVFCFTNDIMAYQSFDSIAKVPIVLVPRKVSKKFRKSIRGVWK